MRDAKLTTELFLMREHYIFAANNEFHNFIKSGFGYCGTSGMVENFAENEA